MSLPTPDRRGAIDALGFPAGRFIDWIEDWSTFPTQAGTFDTQVGRWKAKSTAGSGNANVEDATHSVSPFHEHWAANKLSAPSGSTGDYVRLQHAACFTALTTGTVAELEATVTPVGGADLAKVDLLFGWRDNANLDPTNIITGAFFRRPAGASTNWFCRTLKNGGSPVDVDTGISADSSVFQHLRVEYEGNDSAPDGAAHARFFLDGIKGADFGTALPFSATDTKQVPFMAAICVTTGGTAGLFVGPVRVRQILASGGTGAFL